MKEKYILDVLDRDSHTFWPATITNIHDWGAYYEMTVHSRGYQYQVLFGTCSTTRWIMLPDRDIGCAQSFHDDFFWNTDRLCGYLDYPDALTIVSAVAHLCREYDIHD